MFPEGKSPKVCLGNSDTVTPVAGVEFWALKDIQDTQSGHCPRRRISALVLRNLPTTILMSEDDLITLGLLLPAWPNHGEKWGTRIGDVPRTDFPADRKLTEKVFNMDTDVSLIPGFKEGRMPTCIKAICTMSVFKKSLTAEKRTKFKPATLPLSKGAKPTRRSKTC